jgi:hypothetical protein
MAEHLPTVTVAPSSDAAVAFLGAEPHAPADEREPAALAHVELVSMSTLPPLQVDPIGAVQVQPEQPRESLTDP